MQFDKEPDENLLYIVKPYGDCSHLVPTATARARATAILRFAS
jgi:hypothetical protein